MNVLRSAGAFGLMASTFYLVFFALKESNPSEDFRIRAMKAATLLGVFVWAVTEVLSGFNRLATPFVAGCWIGSTLLLFFAFGRRPPEVPASLPWTAFAVLGVLFMLAIIALAAPPTTWDSMTYHMPRVMHWKTHQALDFYATDTPRELYQYPFAEMVILHSVLLSGGDWLASLSQFFALIGCMAGVSAIVKVWKGGVRAEWYACLLAITLPMAILQSTSTQTDLVTSFWLVCFAAFTLLLSADSSVSLYAYAGASLGLAILTKPTAGIWAVPFLVWYAVILFRKPSLLSRVFLTAGIVVVILGGVGWRCIQAFGSPMATNVEPGFSVASSRHDLPAFLTVLARNIALHMGTAPSSRWNQFVWHSTLRLQRRLGIEENDPSIIWPSSPSALEFSTHEDYAGNFVHFLLMMMALAFLLVRSAQRIITMRLYTACILLGFLLFCFFLRWQPWHSRLHLPAFLLFLPCVAIAMDRCFPRRGQVVVSILLVIQAVPFVVGNMSRPLIGSHSVLIADRTTQMFTNRPEIQAPYQTVASALLSSRCYEVGLMSTSGDDWEYPLWALTRDRVAFEHVGVRNSTSTLESSPPPPCAVVTMTPEIDSVEVAGHVYSKALSADPLGLWKK